MTAPSPSVDIRKNNVIRLRTNPEWLPEKYHNRAERINISVKPTAGECRALEYKEFQTPSEWAPKNRKVTYGPLKGSSWDNDFMPHMRGVMDASFFPSVRVIGNCKSPQGGSSAGAETIISYVADNCPGDALIVYPDKITAAKRSTDYLQPVFTESPRLRGLLTGSDDDMASLRIKLRTMLIYMGWAGSATSLGNVSSQYLVGDEVDKWVIQATKKEAETIKLFFERMRSFRYTGKAWLISTPTLPSGPIWKYMNEEAQVIFDYWIPCPECGKYFPMSAKHIKVIAETRDPKKIEEEDLSRYVVPCCSIMMDDWQREKQLRKGLWHSRVPDDQVGEQIPMEMWDYLEEYHPSKICFHSPGWISPLVSNSEILASFFRGLTSVKAMQYYDNQIAAQAHVASKQIRKADVILKLKDARPSGLVPGNGQVACLVAGVDTQTDSFIYTIRAVGWGIEQPSWLIRSGEVTSKEKLIQYLLEDSYQDAAGLYYPVHLAVIDTGGDRTSEIYDLCALHPGRLQAYKGASGKKAQPHSFTTIDTYPGTNKLIPGGVRLAICDTHYYKDKLAGKLRKTIDDPGAYLFHSEITEEFANQMCAETVDQRGFWENPKKLANHFWDCSVMEQVGIDILQVKFWQQGAE